MLEYKGFKAQIDFDDQAGLFVGEVINMNDGAVFSGRSVDELRAAFEKAVERRLNAPNSPRQTLERCYSGRISLRIKPDMHRRIADQAAKNGMTVTEWVVKQLSENL